jgi:uncharacterized protein (TIGR02145 family)
MHSKVGDFDLNDLVLRYQSIQFRHDVPGEPQKVSGLMLSYKVVAKGGQKWLGFALRLQGIRRDQLDSAKLMKFTSKSTFEQQSTGKPGNMPEIEVNANGAGIVKHGAKNGSEDIVIQLSGNVCEFLENEDGDDDYNCGEHSNTSPDVKPRRGKTVQLFIKFKDPILASNMPVAPYDPFIFVSGNFSRQIHLPFTDGAGASNDLSFLRKSEDGKDGVPAKYGDDCSNVVDCGHPSGTNADNSDRWYVNYQGLPWAMEFLGKFTWAQEGQRIDRVYTNIATWFGNPGLSLLDHANASKNNATFKSDKSFTGGLGNGANKPFHYDKDTGKGTLRSPKHFFDITTKCSASFTCGQSFTDKRDGQIYKTVQIGNQCWMAQNLRFYVSGVSDEDDKLITTSPSNYGRLYSWPTMMNGASSSSSNPSGVQGICPDGWHVPSDSEWGAIPFNRASDLKSASDWNGTDSLNFNVYPTGYIYHASSPSQFLNKGKTTAFWTTTNWSSDPTRVWYRVFTDSSNIVNRISDDHTQFSYSVRCIKD